MQDYMNGASRNMEAMHHMEARRSNEDKRFMEAAQRMEASRGCGTNIDKFPVAMAYVPWQKFDKMFDDLEKAYCSGTIFPELNKPFTGRRCV